MENAGKHTLLAEICESELLAVVNTLPEGFEFSDEFERRMSGVIGVGDKPSVRARLKTALIIAAIFASGFCLGMGREPNWNYIVKNNSDGSKSVSFDIGSIKASKEHIEDVYELTIPAGYELMQFDKSSHRVFQIWSSNSKRDLLFFAQYIPSAYSEAYFDEAATYYFDKDGTQYYIDQTDSGTAIVWEKDGYVFLISVGFNKDETLRLCKSLKISEDTFKFSQTGK